MARTTVNRAERLSQVLSVRLTEYQAKRLQNTIRNFGLKGSSSEQLRLLLSKAHFSSVRHATKHRELRRLARLKEEKLKKAAAVRAEEEALETEAYEEWFEGLGEKAF